MGDRHNFREILTLSAASAALLQSTAHASDELVVNSSESHTTPNGQITSNTEKLLLAPPQHDAMLKLYAAHSSHSSHSSHASGMSDYSTPAPYYPPSAPPVTAPTYPATPQPKPLPVVPLKTTTAPSVTTNTASLTNALSGEDVAKNKEHIESLTKQAAEGSAYAQYSLGICYLYGSDGAEKNVEKAKAFLELSAVQGNAFAKTKLEELGQDTKKPDAP